MRLSLAVDAPEDSIDTQIPMSVFSVKMENIKITITTMVADIRLKNAKFVLLVVLLQGCSSIAPLKVCPFNFILHVLKQIISERPITVTWYRVGTLTRMSS